jgi:ribosome-associated translation inhibitor RaiA
MFFSTESPIMEIQITCRNVSLTDDQMESAERRLRYALGRFESRIQSTRITLTDVDGPGDGSDVLCRLKIILKRDGDVIVGDTDVSVEAAIANVANRGARSVARLLDRLQDHQDVAMPWQGAFAPSARTSRRLRDEN